MSNWPFRFVHAADFHLELPLGGVSLAPDHLRELFLEAPYLAAERVFETACSEAVEFLILSGDILQVDLTGPRGPLFLVKQFERLAERGIMVYWAGGRVDPPDAWPTSVALPDNVHCFPLRRPDEIVHERDDAPLARLLGAARGRRKIRAGDFAVSSDDLFSIAVTSHGPELEKMAKCGIDYWALGGRHAAQTLLASPYTVHDPGTPQGRSPAEAGSHGCTLVEVDERRQVRTSHVSANLLCFRGERIEVNSSHTRDDLEILLHERVESIRESAASTNVVVSWTVDGQGPVLDQLNRGRLPAELLDILRREYGQASPCVWSESLTVESASTFPAEWYEQRTIRGDFLRQLRHCQMNPSEPLELESYLSERQMAGALGAVAVVPEGRRRDRVLAEAAMLGVDLLTGEGPKS